MPGGGCVPTRPKIYGECNTPVYITIPVGLISEAPSGIKQGTWLAILRPGIPWAVIYP